MNDSSEDYDKLAETITIGDPRLEKMKHLFEPYHPYEFLKVYCTLNHEYTVSYNGELNKEKAGSEDAVKLIIKLKKYG